MEHKVRQDVAEWLATKPQLPAEAPERITEATREALVRLADEYADAAADLARTPCRETADAYRDTSRELRLALTALTDGGQR